jgi:hypothetical protein
LNWKNLIDDNIDYNDLKNAVRNAIWYFLFFLSQEDCCFGDEDQLLTISLLAVNKFSGAFSALDKLYHTSSALDASEMKKRFNLGQIARQLIISFT